MISNEVKELVNKLKSFDQALLIEYLVESLNKNEDQDILDSWIIES
jgi:hypothetical protein